MFRIDGKAFHTYTKGLERPFDEGFVEDMNATAVYLCEQIQNAKCAYVQSDEISVLVSDFDTITTDAWFDNNLQKMVSVAASLATSRFNQLRLARAAEGLLRFAHKTVSDENETIISRLAAAITAIKPAQFDARAFQIPQASEVKNYFIWRQQDATRNSIASVAQSLYSHKELNGKNSNQQQELIFQKGLNWNDFNSRVKRGGFIEKVTYVNGVDVRNIKDSEIALTDVVRNKWTVVECPIFSQETSFLDTRISVNN